MKRHTSYCMSVEDSKIKQTIEIEMKVVSRGIPNPLRPLHHPRHPHAQPDERAKTRDLGTLRQTLTADRRVMTDAKSASYWLLRTGRTPIPSFTGVPKWLTRRSGTERGGEGRYGRMGMVV